MHLNRTKKKQKKTFSKQKVLLVTPSFKTKGGMQNYCRVIRNKLEAEINGFAVGRESDREILCLTFFRLLRVYSKFILLIIRQRFDIIHINTALDKKSLLRDGIIICLSCFVKSCIVVTFHGWSTTLFNEIKGLRLFLFKLVFLRSDSLIVLAEEFKDKLRKIGFKQKIFVEKTFADDELYFDVDEKLISRKNLNINKKFVLLFLSRLIVEKGILTTLEAVKRVYDKTQSIKLIVAGDGYALQEAKEFVKNNKMDYVDFVGHIDGPEKKEIFLKSDAYILPTTYGEGIPISAVEAMLCGLPVIIRPEGGIKEFFEDGKMGFLIESIDPVEYADSIEKLMSNKILKDSISLFNHKYAIKNFLASSAAERLMSIYTNTQKIYIHKELL